MTAAHWSILIAVWCLGGLGVIASLVWTEGWPHTRDQYARALMWATVTGAMLGLVGPFVVYFLIRNFLI